MMSVRFQSWNYLVAFLACALLSALAFAIGQMTFDSIPCKWRGYSADDFLAYCRSQRYADYEHGAFYYGLEPDIRTNVRNAKVLFLGSSKIQAAFSTNAVRSYFDKLRIDFFVMGFGYAESSRFALSVLQRSEATPRLLVINADPFFTEHVSVPGQEAFDGALHSYGDWPLNSHFNVSTARYVLQPRSFVLKVNRLFSDRNVMVNGIGLVLTQPKKLFRSTASLRTPCRRKK
jgi:hypothetical protein